jgi:hypothetical protein
VVEFADVAGPGVGAHRLERAVVEAGDGLAVALDVLLEEMLGEQRMSSRRSRSGGRWMDRVEAEEQILAEFAGGDLGGRSELVAEIRRTLTW